MDRRTVLILTLLAAGISSISLALLWPESDEERITTMLHELADAIGFSEPIENPVFYGSALANRLEDYLTEQVRVDVHDVQARVPKDRGQMAMAAAVALARYGSLDVTLSDVEVQMQDDGAKASARARVIANQGGEMRSESRRVQFVISKEGGDFKVSSVQAEGPE